MGINVLIVDDLKFIKMVLRDLIEKAGFRVVGEASDGLEAIEAFQDRRPDVVILDVTMPRMYGITTLMCSALGQQRLIVQAIQLGARDFIVKPFRAERVISAIKKTLNID